MAEFQQFLPGSGKPQGERLTGILQVLRREVCNPGWPSMGLGGPISSGYVLQQGVLNLGLDISPGLLRHARADEKDPKIRDLLAVALSVARDPSVTKEVRSLARDHPLGSIRQLAIKGLGRLRDAESRDLFLAALNDRYTAVAGESPDGPVKLYPVRIQAASALRAIGERPPAGAVMSVPLPGSESDAAFCAHLLDDQDPESSLTGVQLLIGEGHRGRPYLQAFLKKNENEPSLKQSIELARKSLQ